MVKQSITEHSADSTVTPADVACRYFEAINQSDPDRLDDLLAEDYTHHIEGLPPGRAAIKRMVTMYLAGFSEFRITIDDVLTDGDRVTVRTTTIARHTATFMGHGATGKQFRAMGIDIFRIKQARISEHWSLFDTMTMLQQLGIRH